MSGTKKSGTRHPCVPPLFSFDEWNEIIRVASLSPRQAEIVGLVVQSRKDKEIAAALDIRCCTVRTHFEECKERLAAHDRMSIAYRVFWTFRHLIEPQRYPWNPRRPS